MSHGLEDIENIKTIDESIIKALNHDLRRKILLEIYENGMGTYSDLTKILDVKSGSFYHHMRILEDAQLINQLGDKTYDLTTKGARIIEYFRDEKEFIAKPEPKQIFTIYNRLFNILSIKNEITIVLGIFFLLLIVSFLTFVNKVGIVGFFVVSHENNIILFLVTTGIILVNNTLFIGFLHYYHRRLIRKIEIIGHLLIPYAIFALILVTLGFIPFIQDYSDIISNLSFLMSFIFQIFSITYYLYVLRRLGLKAIDKTLIMLLLINYLNLLIIFVVF